MEDSSNDKFQSSINHQPIEKRTQSVAKEVLDASYLDFNEDSISMASNTSTVQSSFVRYRIHDHEMKKLEMIRDQIDPQINHNNVVINFVLNGDNSQANSNSFNEVVNEILTHTKIPKKVENTTKISQWNMHTIFKIIRRPKYIIFLLVLLLALIGSAFGLHLILSINKAKSTDTTTSVPQLSTTMIVDKTTTTSTSIVSTTSKTTPVDTTKTTQLVTTTEPSTTENIPLDPKLVIITRTEWGAKPMSGNRKQSKPIDRVVFIQTYTDESCTTEVNQSN